MLRLRFFIPGLLLAFLSLVTVASAQDAAVVEKEEKKPAAKKKKKEKAKPYSVAAITLKGGLAEGNTVSAFGADDANLLGTLKRIRKVAEDSKVQQLVLRLRNPAVGRGTLNEVRRAIADVQEAGKEVWAEIEMATPGDYLIACHCDKIIMPESGYLVLPGTRAEVMFYRNLFDKIHVEPDFLQMGDFKGAGEPYMRDSMSDEFRAQLETVLKDFHDQMIEQIAESRDISIERVQAIVDDGLLTANQAMKFGLIDHVAYEQDWQDMIETDGKELKVVENYAKKKVDTDFSGMGGLIKMMELLSGGKSGSSKSKAKKIAIVYAVGAITSGKSAQSLMGGATMGSDTIVAALEKAADDDKVGAIVLRVNSPGGSALASDLIWNQIEQIEKPIVCSMGDIAASGGYYIAMGCDKIFAEPATLTGSIGVVGGKIAVGELMEEIGLNTDVISYGKNSGMFGTSEKFSDSERRIMRAMMEETYEQFTSKAAAGREMELDDLKKLAGGRVWSGRQAKDNGLIDELGTLRDALFAAAELADLEIDDEPELIVLPEAKSFLEQLIEGESVSAPNVQAYRALLPAKVREAVSEMMLLERLSQERVMLLTPIHVPLN